MKICPIAIAVGCPRCALFKACPAKALLGGYKEVAPLKVPVVDPDKSTAN